MPHKSVSNMRQAMVVVSTTEQWLSLKSLLLNSSGDNHLQLTFSSLESHQACDLTVDGRSISLHYADWNQDMSEEDVRHAIDVCYKSCTDGICTFLLLIRGGHYTKGERTLMETLQAHFGFEALKFLMVLSLEDGKVAVTLDDALLELINMCDGRYCRIASSAARDELRALLKVVDYMLTKNGMSGYTQAMLTEAKRRGAGDSSHLVPRQRAQEVEVRERAFEQTRQQREEKRAAETEVLQVKRAVERWKEATEKAQNEIKRGSLEEAVRSHRAMLQLQTCFTDDSNTKKMSAILLGLSGSGKSSALNVILEGAANQYSVNGSGHGRPQPTLFCERKEAFAAGQQLVLVDTPELWDEDGVENLEVVKDCLALSLPGPHVFLLVLQVGRFTQGDREMLGQLQRIFGRDMAQHAIVLFARFGGSQQWPQRIEDYVSGAPASLQGLIQKCGSRYYELSIMEPQDALSYPQVKDLLSGIYKLVASYGGRPHSTKRFSTSELQERKKVIEGRKEGALERNYLLRDT